MGGGERCPTALLPQECCLASGEGAGSDRRRQLLLCDRKDAMDHQPWTSPKAPLWKQVCGWSIAFALSAVLWILALWHPVQLLWGLLGK